MGHTPRNIAVIGLGTFGKSLARELTRVGDRVLGIDINEARVAELADEIDATLEADMTDAKAMKQCGLDAFDVVVVAIGRIMDASLLTALNLLKAGHNHIWVKAQSEHHETLLRAIGISNVVQPEGYFGYRLAQVLHNPVVKDFLSLSNGRFIVQIKVPGHLVGQALDGLNLQKKFDLKCIGVSRGEDVFISECETTELQAGDDILIYGSRANLRNFADSL